MRASIPFGGGECRVFFHKECLKYHGHKGDPGMTLEICRANGEKAQMILVWVEALRVGNNSHPQGLGVVRVRP